MATGSLAINKIILSGGPNTNNAASYFSNTTISATTAGNVIPAGAWYIPATANLFVTVNIGNSTVNLWSPAANVANVTNGGAGGGGLVISDGVNVFANATTNITSLTIMGVSGGINVTSTFANV